MTSLLQEVENKALALPAEERSKLAHKLVVSLDDALDKKVETDLDAEIERRVKEIKSGVAKGRPAEDILAEIRAQYS